MHTPFVPLPPVAMLVTPHLPRRDAAQLLRAVNGVRSGEKSYTVAVTYHKVTKAKPRIAGSDYQPLPGVEPIFHEGTLVAAKENKRGVIYLLLSDAARAPVTVQGQAVEDEEDTGWTALSLAGLLSFRIVAESQGPLVKAREAAKALALAEVQAALARIQGQ